MPPELPSPGNLPELDCVSASSKAAGCSLNTRNRRRYMPVPTSGFPCRWKVDACVFSAERPIIGRGDVRLSVRSISGAVLGFPIAAGLSTVRDRSVLSARAREVAGFGSRWRSDEETLALLKAPLPSLNPEWLRPFIGNFAPAMKDAPTWRWANAYGTLLAEAAYSHAIACELRGVFALKRPRSGGEPDREGPDRRCRSDRSRKVRALLRRD